MVSLLEKVWLHRSSRRFEPELVTTEINPSHYCSVPTCVKVSLTRNCRAATQSSQPMGNEALHKTTDEGQMETENIHCSDSRHISMFTGVGIWQDRPHSGFVTCCVTWSFHRQQWETLNFFHTKYNGARVLQTKGHAQKHTQKYSKLKHWNPLA